MANVEQVVHTSVEVGGVVTHLNRAGAGNKEAILWLHGSGPGATGWSNWQYALPVFGVAYDCLAPDLVGFGASFHPDPPPTGMRKWMRLWVNQILSLLDVLEIRRAHLVGNSMGGAIALHLLMEAPDRFDKVVLMGPIGAPVRLTAELDRVWGFYEDPSPAAMAQFIQWFVYDQQVVGSQLETIAQARFATAMIPEVRRSYEAMFPRPRQVHLDQLVVPDGALERITHPVLLIHGRDDRIVPLDTSLHLLRRIPNSQLHVFGQCGHWTQVEQRERFHSLVREFLGQRNG